MRKSPKRRTPAVRRLRWQPDARERLRALLPELVVSVVSTACMTTVVNSSIEADLPALLMTMLATQLFVQTLLYVCTYLVDSTAFAGFGWLVVMACMTVSTIFSFFMDPSGSPSSAVPIAMAFGAFLFYLTRLRSLFVFLLVEMFALIGEIPLQGGTLVVHLVGMAFLAALFVMRSSATRITMFPDLGSGPMTPDDGDSKGPLSSMGMFGQVAAFGVAVGALCLVVALAAAPLMGHGHGVGKPMAGTTVTTSQPERPVESQPDVGGQGVTAPAPSTEPSVEGDGPRGATGVLDGLRQALRGIYPSASLVALMLLIIAALPVAVRLLARLHARRTIERERSEADCVARIYQACISRLRFAGIVRDEAETPWEFLVLYEEELERLTKPAGLGIDGWETLTGAYERARYADASPTESELETCWRVYDALPVCLREKVGWPSYLTGAFWRM